MLEITTYYKWLEGFFTSVDYLSIKLDYKQEDEAVPDTNLK